MTSPRPQPTALKLLKGETRTERLNLNEPKPQPNAPNPPEWLSAGALELWHGLAPKLERLGILTEIDGEAFASLCYWYDKFIQATDDIEEQGDIYQADSGYTQSTAAVTNAQKYFDKALKLMQEFGLTPSSRTKLQVKTDDGDYEWASILD